MPWPEPSINDHGAPWNEDDEGGCACSHCQRKKRDIEREESGIDDYLRDRMRDEGF